MMRLNKYIAETGFASRRKADELIEQGRVSVNNVTIFKLGFEIDEATDIVKVDGQKIKIERKVYYLLNKPTGYVSTTSDEKGRNSVVDLIKTKAKIYPVGRLDYDTTGVLLLTNDGDFTNMMLHPSNNIEREYLVTLDKELQEEDRLRLTKNVILDGRKSHFLKIKYPQKKNYYLLTVTTNEGRNHFVKNMFALLGYKVIKLKRIRFGIFNIKNIKEGDYVILNESDIKKFMNENLRKNSWRKFDKSK